MMLQHHIIQQWPPAHIYCTNNPSLPLIGPAVTGPHPIVIALANLSCVQFCGKVSNCSLFLSICISSPLRWRFLLFLDLFCPRKSAIIQCAVCEMCRELIRVYLRLCQLAVFKSFPPCPFMSIIHSTETSSWLVNVFTLFHLESIFFCCTFCKRFPTLGQPFLIISFDLGCLPHHTSHHSSSLYMEPSPLCLSPLWASAGTRPWGRWSHVHGESGDVATDHRPLDLYEPPFSLCINLRTAQPGVQCLLH